MPSRKKTLSLVVVLSIMTLLCSLLIFVSPSPVQAQAPSDDPYEQNDDLISASSIPSVVELPNMTIFPAGDPDFYRALMTPGDYRAQVIATPGLDLTLQVYDPANTLIITNNDPAGPNAVASWTVPSEGYYIIEVTNATALEGFYLLRLQNITPTATPTFTPTTTANPTATSVYPTNTPTPDLGGRPDYTEPNFDFAHAYRIVPGDVLDKLNFNSGTPGQIDNDFFVMAVRPGISYTCQTQDLGPSVDTNIILYWSANVNDVIGGNDDENTQAGLINSKLTFTSQKEGDIYVLAGYKYPESEDIPFPGAATYSLTCYAAQATPTPIPGGDTGSGSSGGMSLPLGSAPAATPLWIEQILAPQTSPTPTSAPVGTVTIDIILAYDENDNGEVDPNEGVTGVSIRVIDPTTNNELSHGFTDASGSSHFVIATNNAFQVTIPFLHTASSFRAGSPVEWTILIPASTAPGLIP